MLFKIILILEFCLGWAHIFLHIVYAFPRIACYGTRCFRHIHIDVSLMFGSSDLTAWLWSFVDISLHQTKFDRMCVIKREEVTIYVIRRDINLTSRHLLIQLKLNWIVAIEMWLHKKYKICPVSKRKLSTQLLFVIVIFNFRF